MAEFVLVLLVLVPLVMGIVQVGLVLHVRNTLTAAASDGARAAAPVGADSSDARTRTRTIITTALSDHYARDITVGKESVAGGTAVVVRVSAEVPALGLFGPSVPVRVAGRALQEEEP
ncbi:TadE/TadG family type IV pilus assembly protein [Aeromicrobium sp. Root495]|uniref:TadE/TadG family type IV pilus assembly protein n=1 Tax=Aeromicrobium sp. Root495 TaxID=1736550 RepID=UPI001F187829|nr:TadE/TadG family type IV pilus assembly protein [Aeromicrobium sp. Root495]